MEKNNINLLKKKIQKKEAVIGIVGLGYVGLPLAITFEEKEFNVIGIDISEGRVNSINKGVSYISDVTNDELKKIMKSGKLKVTINFRAVKKLDAVIICVPTPLRKNKKPDMSYIKKAVGKIKNNIQKGQIIVLESTTYPGTTREILLPILESTALKEGKDFYLAFSPERIDPGNKIYKTENTPKVIGGISRHSTDIATFLYNKVIKKVVPVSSADAAEMVKLLENTFRIVNIALVNEIATLCDKFNFDIWEIIDAAKTKPYGYMPFYPGPGVGGHCLNGNEALFVDDGKKAQLSKISEVFDSLSKENDTIKKTFNKATYLKPGELKIASFDRFSRKGSFENVEILSKRNYCGDMVHIKTNDGRKIKLTDQHPVFVYKDENLVTKFAKDIKKDEEIVVALNLSHDSLKKSSKKIDLIDHLDDYLIQKVRVRNCRANWKNFKKYISEDIRTNKREFLNSYYEWFRGNAIPLYYFLDAEKRGIIRVRRQDLLLITGRGPSASSTRNIFNLDKDFCRLIGYYLSEGCATTDKSTRIRFTFNVNESEYIEDLLQILKSFGLRYSIYRSKIYKSICIKVSNNLFGYLIKDILKCGKDSYSMKIPDNMLTFPEKHRINLLAGLLRGDGGVDYYNGKRTYKKNNKIYNHMFNSCNINYYTISNSLFQQVIFLLQGLDIVPRFKKTRENLINISGYKQILKLKNLFLGEKLNKIKSYFTENTKILTNKTFRKFQDIATIKVHEIKKVLVSEPVYSVEMAGPHAIVTSFGIVLHNCIPVDPLYLSWKAKEHGFDTKFIDLASHVNEQMPSYVIGKTEKILKDNNKELKNAKVLIIGVAYKKDVKDLRESPSIKIINTLVKKKANVSYYDPYFPYFKINGIDMKPISLNKETLKTFDIAILLADHSGMDYKFFAEHLKRILDTRNIFERLGIKAKNIIKL